MNDPLKVTLISTIEPKSENLEDIMPLSEYKFDRSHLALVKRTLKRWRILVGSLEKPTVKGFEESTLWDISGLDVTRVGVETSAVIAGMALAYQTSTEAMAKEITWLKQSATHFQAELVENVKNVAEDK